MRFSRIISCGAALCLFGEICPAVWAGDTTVATAVSARVGNGYQRARKSDGTFKPEYYAISNGGRVYGTGRDSTVDRVQYPEVAAIAMRLLAGQNYHYANNAGEATLLLVLQWGSTIPYNRENYNVQIGATGKALANLRAAGGGAKGSPWGSGMPSALGDPFGGAVGAQAASAAVDQRSAEELFETEMYKLLQENRARDAINLPNARILGYLDDINAADGPQRFAGAGARFDDLITDIEESRYYIIVSAYDFQELVKKNKKKLMWTTRVSVRSPGNRFDDSAAAMLKSASKYFGQDSGRLIRGEENKGTVELDDVRFLGEAKEKADADKPDGR